MENKDFDEIRHLIEKRFLEWYKNKPKERFESSDFEKNISTSNLDVYEEMVNSFNEILKRPRTIEACTLRKLFYYKETNFRKSTLEVFNEYVRQKDLKNHNNTISIENELEKWKNSTISPIIEHHYFMPIEKYRENIAFIITDIENVKEEYLVFFMINSIYYGDYAMHYLIAPCYSNLRLIKILVKYAFCSWLRVSWRASFILSQLNSDLVNKELFDNIDLSENDLKMAQIIKNKQVDKYLENIISGEYDINSKFYATQVLKQINYKNNNR